MINWADRLVIDGVELNREDVLATWLFNVNEALRYAESDVTEDEALRAIDGHHEAFRQAFLEMFCWRNPNDPSMLPDVWFNDAYRRGMGWPQQVEHAYEVFLKNRTQ